MYFQSDFESYIAYRLISAVGVLDGIRACAIDIGQS